MKKILIIEDDFDVAGILPLAFGTIYEARVVTDCNKLTQELNSFLPDLILTDYCVGQKLASDIVSTVRSATHSRDIPVVLLTGHPDIETIALEIKAAAYICKPFDLANLRQCITTVLAHNIRKKPNNISY